MRLLGKMSWLELKLFLREPLTVLFALALPVLVLFVMGGVFAASGLWTTTCRPTSPW